MEAMKMRAAFAVVLMIIAMFSVQNVAAVDAPAPAPTSDAAAFFPATLASLIALAFGLLF
ncbi:arabinogalactan peptide 13-like [Chenopodium quinoa]|uniref:arabinogalactan peptide 13-like n=1 Tax=Chenopodium quinoa TaxID=63459 RepID=UPI000B77365C|nr:arabinogalactan peptide 13-like [Chenopodium quinoa]